MTPWCEILTLLRSCSATEDLDDEVPLGGLAKLSSNVAGMVAGLEGKAPFLRRISLSRLTSPTRALDTADVQLSPKRVGILKGSAGLPKGNSLAAMLECADSEASLGSAAGVLGLGGSPVSGGASRERVARYGGALCTADQGHDCALFAYRCTWEPRLAYHSLFSNQSTLALAGKCMMSCYNVLLIGKLKCVLDFAVNWSGVRCSV